VQPLIFIMFFGAALAGGADPLTVRARITAVPGLVDAATIVLELQVDLRYATSDNFLHEPIYGDLRQCFLNRDAATMLATAQSALRDAHPELRLRVYDCARPQFVQEQMWKLVAGTPEQGYVADPARRSIHNFGCAVDLTVADVKGQALDMGTPYDFFGDLAGPSHEERFLAEGRLTPTQVANRLILRDAMTQAKWRTIGNEWWHFDCAPQKDARRRYPPIP
jgi:D-alanyl-D-alanine dipeptidase